MTCFFFRWFSGISHKQQWWSREGAWGARALPYFLDQTEAQRAEKIYLRVWMTKPPVIWRTGSATEQPLKHQHLVIPYGVVAYKRIQLDDLLHHRLTSHHRVHHRVTFFYHWLPLIILIKITDLQKCVCRLKCNLPTILTTQADS